MPSCVVKWCRNHTDHTKNSEISFHVFPKGPIRRELWTNAVRLERQENDWMPSKRSKICSIHFKDEDLYLSKRGFSKLHNTAIPICTMGRLPAQTQREESVGPSTSTLCRIYQSTEDSSKEDQVNSGPIDQCRCCGEFSKQCASVSNDDRITLSYNDLVVQIDFNNHTLPNTICKNCHKKLQEVQDFIKTVQNAQKSLISIAEPDNVEDPLETLVVKTEDTEDSDDEGNKDKDYESNDSKEEDSNDDDNENSQDIEDEDDKEGILNPLTTSETVMKASTAKKRKTNASDNSKQAKVTKSGDNELISDIKEEVIEYDNNDHDYTSVSKTGPDVKPSEVELATSALLFEMRSLISGCGTEPSGSDGLS